MKLIDIQRHYFTLKGDKGRYFCTEAETDISLNVKVIHFVDATNMGGEEMVLRGREIERVIPGEMGLGMAYQPASDVKKLNTQTPDSMGYDIHEALRKLTEAVGGNVTDYVCERLQWSRTEIEDRLLAEQVDAVALAIYNHEARKQAMIIGDQTGIGKGRVASSMIRYAMVKGLIPIYCTENAGLFSDNYRDMCDIGLKSLRPFIVNQSTSGQTDARIKVLNDQDEFVVVHEPMTNKKEREKIFASGKMPSGYDYILTTYSQLSNAYKSGKEGPQTSTGKDIEKYQWLLSIAPKAFFIFDESHNISGSKAVAEKWWDPASVKMSGSNIFYCFNELAKKANGVIFLSATFAKRPENLVIYANRTCVKESGLSDVELVKAISEGGEALQEVISSDIVREGQMIRRESVYDGIKVNYITLDKSGADEFGTPDLEKQHRETSDYITSIINEINEFEKTYIFPYLDGLVKEGSAANIGIKKTSSQLGVAHEPIFSKLFMIVNQMLFSIKAQAVAEHAIRRLNEGKKVVIGLSNTMESFLNQFDEEGEINCDFTAVLDKALRSTLKYGMRDKEGEAETEYSYIDISDLDPDGQDMYFNIKERIAKGSSGITVSPIDLITQKIEREGFRVSEVTGRKKKILLENEQGTKGRIVNREYVTRNVAFGAFQNNQSDVLIINASGATGASAHATTKNTNLTEDQVKPRVMIIAQMELDVNKEVQKRGRINRTGQIKSLPPSYDYLISAIPAEKRLMMMMQKKLKSLDANSTSNQKQSTGIIDTSDFMNKYGDRVCTEYLTENQAINLKLNDPIGAGDEDGGKEKKEYVSIHKVTGYVPVLTCEEQEEFYNSIKDGYDKLVKKLVERGEYDLAVEAMDLDARQVGDLILTQGATNGESKFADAVYTGRYDCKVLRKPYSADEIRVMLSNYMGGKYVRDEAVEKATALALDMKSYYETRIEETINELSERYENKISKVIEAVEAEGGVEADVAGKIAELREECEEKKRKQTARYKNEINKCRVVRDFYCGRACMLDSGNTKAICLGVKVGPAKSKNPYAPSKVNISFAVPNSYRYLEYDIQEEDYRSLLAIIDYSRGMYHGMDERVLENWHEYTRESTAEREVRQIIVGNTLRAYKNKPQGAKLISFTTHDGEVLKGLLVPKGMNGNEKEKIVLSQYSIKKMLPTIKQKLADQDEHTFSLTRGCSLKLNSKSWQDKTPIVFDVKDAKTYKTFIDHKLADFERIAGERTFESWGSGSNRHWNVNVPTDKLNDLANLLESMNIYVELPPSQVSQYFQDDKKLKQGNWGKVYVDKTKIPASENPSKPVFDDIERKKKLLILAKAKIKIAKAKQKQNLK